MEMHQTLTAYKSEPTKLVFNLCNKLDKMGTYEAHEITRKFLSLVATDSPK